MRPYFRILPKSDSTPSKMPTLLPQPVQFKYVAAINNQPGMIINSSNMVFKGSSGQPLSILKVPVQQIINRPSNSPSQVAKQIIVSNNHQVVSSQPIPSTSGSVSSNLKQVVRYVTIPTTNNASYTSRTVPQPKTLVKKASLLKPMPKAKISADSAETDNDVVITATISKEQLDQILCKTSNVNALGGQTVSSSTTKIQFRRPKTDSTSNGPKEVQSLLKVGGGTRSAHTERNEYVDNESEWADMDDVTRVSEVISSNELSREESFLRRDTFSQGTQTEIYSCLYKNNKLYFVDGSNAAFTFLPVETIDGLPRRKPPVLVNSIGIDTSDLKTRLVPKKPYRFLKRRKRKNDLEENSIHDDIIQHLRATPEERFNEETNSNIEKNSFLETNSSQSHFVNTDCPASDDDALDQAEAVDPLQMQGSSDPAFNSHLQLQSSSDPTFSSPLQLQSSNDSAFSSSVQEGGIDGVPSHVQSLVMELRHQINTCLKTDHYGNLAMHQAVIDHDWVKLKSLCMVLKSIQSHLDHVNDENETALLLAVLEQERIGEGVCEGVTILLAEGASQRIPDAQGCYPIHHAVRLGHVELVKALLAADHIKFVINRHDDNGLTPLHLAASLNHRYLISLLIPAGADHSIRERKSGKTAYFLACEKANVEAATMLAAMGASATLLNYAGQLPPLIERPLPPTTGKNTKWQKNGDKRKVSINSEDEPLDKRYRFVHDVSSETPKASEIEQIDRSSSSCSTRSSLESTWRQTDNRDSLQSESQVPSLCIGNSAEEDSSSLQEIKQEPISPENTSSSPNTSQHQSPRISDNTLNRSGKEIYLESTASTSRNPQSTKNSSNNKSKKGTIIIVPSHNTVQDVIIGESSYEKRFKTISVNKQSSAKSTGKPKSIHQMFQLSFNSYYEDKVNQKNKPESDTPLNGADNQVKANNSVSAENNADIERNRELRNKELSNNSGGSSKGRSILLSNVQSFSCKVSSNVM